MYKTTLSISFVSAWHVGSGLGDGAIADAVLNRDANGLPWLPGTAIKGALREASWRLALCDRDGLSWLSDFFFGRPGNDEGQDRPGRLRLGAGSLDGDIAAWLLGYDEAARKDFVSDMTVIRQQTRLNDDKTVVAHSLRSVECGIPGINFTASLEALIEPDWEEWFGQYLTALCANVKSMGGYRSRGLGRCRISHAHAAKGPVRVPSSLPQGLLKHKPEK